MKFWLGALATLLVLQPREIASAIQYETIVRTVYAEKDSEPRKHLMPHEIEEAERQGICLWQFMKDRDIQITLNNVLVSGEWTDIRGGACYLIGEDDEPLAQIYIEEPS